MSKGKQTTEYNEIDDIKNDLQSLKSNVVALTQHITENGAEKFVSLETRAAKAVRKMTEEGERRYKNVEKQVREKPGQALLVAFAGGILASILLNNRRG